MSTPRTTVPLLPHDLTPSPTQAATTPAGGAAAETTGDARTMEAVTRDVPPEHAASDVVLPLVDSTHYEFINELGRGGMGIVSLAIDRRLRRKLAVKELLNPAYENDRRFVREALVTARLEHPSIVPVHEAGRWPSGKPFYAMKLLDGRPLSAILNEATNLDERLATLPYLVAVADAVAYAHSRGVVHRDLKPNNVIVGAFGETMVIDWGLAKILQEPEDAAAGNGTAAAGKLDMPATVGTGARVGTPGFASPEQSSGTPVDARTDVYALGATLHQLLTGKLPPPCSFHSPESTRAPLSLSPELPTALAALCRRALALDAAERPADARAFRLELEAAINRRTLDTIVEHALRDVERLEAAIEARQESRPRLYERFGACRFGFQQGLAVERDDAAALGGLVRAVTALVRYELAAGDLAAARSLLEQLSPAPASLVAEVEEASRRRRHEEARKAHLLALGSEHDTSVGWRARLLVILIVGGSWTATPVIAMRAGPITYRGYLIATLAFALTGLLVARLVPDMRRSAINRALLYGAVAVHLLQGVMYVGHRAIGLTVAVSQAQHLLVWSTTLSCVAVAVDRRLLVAPASYAVGFLIASYHPATTMWMMAAGNLILTLTSIAIWGRPPRRE